MIFLIKVNCKELANSFTNRRILLRMLLVGTKEKSILHRFLVRECGEACRNLLYFCQLDTCSNPLKKQKKKTFCS